MQILNFLESWTWINYVDISAVLIVIYMGIILIKRTRIQNLLPVLIGIVGLFATSKILQLTTFNWLIEQFFIILLVLILIVFQPEIRRAAEKIRRGRFFLSAGTENTANPLLVKKLLTSVDQLSTKKIGALIVLEQRNSLDDYTESGIIIDAHLSSELLTALFWPGSPTHDGAVFVRGSNILSAGCLLPLTNVKLPDQRLGTRHMSAIGLSEETDALIIVVSEETGTISIAEKGNLTRFLNKEALEKRLFSLYKESEGPLET